MDEFREKMIVIMRESIYCTHGQVADQILDIKTDFWEGFKQFTIKEFLIRFDGIKEKE